MNAIVEDLNGKIRRGNPYVYELLSGLGRELYFPRGILTQSAEAKEQAYRFDATIGIATENGQPLYLPLIQETLSDYEPKELYPYAPAAGKPELRQAWREKMLRENPSLRDKSFSQPVVTSALTHGLSIVADMFAEAGDAVILPDKLWGNYNLIFSVRRGAGMKTFPFFSSEGLFNVRGLRETLLKQRTRKKAILLLNFPNNPTGYTPGEREAAGIVEAVREAAEAGINLVVVTDDAYFGLFYEDTLKESLFGRIAQIHPRVLAVKVDGATKEEYVWGFRVGFLTFSAGHPEVHRALENKAMGCIRGTVSSVTHPSQSFVLHALKSPAFRQEKEEKYLLLKERALEVKKILAADKFAEVWEPYPFNSGYFMCLRLKSVKAETLRRHLLQHYGVGVISLGDSDLRIAFSSVAKEDLAQLFELVYQGVKDLKQLRD
ncbi:aminotransferase class I/II-fold pyridoxal phosphate-dependent enzyme [Acididesulfobacillus acetoxydans]|nr:aminotransferase class I/II-fold pyridoxal phosphate-dependent enzyme [Acididesulfobacillus acetoxydans]